MGDNCRSFEWCVGPTCGCQTLVSFTTTERDAWAGLTFLTPALRVHFPMKGNGRELSSTEGLPQRPQQATPVFTSVLSLITHVSSPNLPRALGLGAPCGGLLASSTPERHGRPESARGQGGLCCMTPSAFPALLRGGRWSEWRDGGENSLSGQLPALRRRGTGQRELPDLPPRASSTLP